TGPAPRPSTAGVSIRWGLASDLGGAPFVRSRGPEAAFASSEGRYRILVAHVSTSRPRSGWVCCAGPGARTGCPSASISTTCPTEDSPTPTLASTSSSSASGLSGCGDQTAHDVLLADGLDGQPLRLEQGAPLPLVASEY